LTEQPQGETDRWRGPSRRLLLLRRLEVGAVALAVAALLVLLALWRSWGAGVVAGCAAGPLVAGLVGAFFMRRRFSAWGYTERDEDLLVRRGVLVSRLSVVPYGRMQFVEVIAGPLERLFGLATVHLHTAAAASDARIPGLERDEAARLRDRLAALGEAQAAGL
jgi:uncharacterized protein